MKIYRTLQIKKSPSKYGRKEVLQGLQVYFCLNFYVAYSCFSYLTTTCIISGLYLFKSLMFISTRRDWFTLVKDEAEHPIETSTIDKILTCFEIRCGLSDRASCVTVTL